MTTSSLDSFGNALFVHATSRATASATAAAPEDADLHERRRLGDGVEDARLATAELLRSVSAAARRGAYAALAAAAETAMAAAGLAPIPIPRLPPKRRF